VLDAWYHQVTAAQAKAADAIAQWEQADTEEHDRKNAWNALSEQQKRRTPLVDTWTPMREAAQDILRGARAQRDNAAATAVSGLTAATQTAPAQPSFAARMVADVQDANSAVEQAKGNFTKGLVGSVTSMVQFIRQVSPTDTYNQTHPADYLKGMADLATGLVVADADPGAAVHGFLAGARKDPAEFAGALTGNLVTTFATGGAGAAKPALSAVKDVGDVAKASELAGAAEDAAKAGSELPRAAPKLDLPHPADTAPTPHEPGPAPSAPGPDTASTHPSDSSALQQHPNTSGPEPRPSPAEAGPAHQPDPAGPGSHTIDSGTPAHGPDASTAGPNAHAASSGPHPDTTTGPHPAQPTDPGPAHPGEGVRPEPAGPQPHSADPAPGPQQHPDLGSRPPQPHDPGPAQHPEPATHPDSAVPHESSPHPDPAHPDPADHATDSTHPGQDHHDAGQNPDHHPSPSDRADADHGTHHEATDAGPEHDRTEHQKTCSDDPVDIATGEFLLPETDIDLPGVLGLVLRRTHHSNYRRGRWFGPSWSATLDMRLVVEHEGVTFLGEDGLMLAYPHAEVRVGVEPTTGGQRWTLTRTDTGSYQVWDQQRELIWHFAPEPVLGGIESRLGNYAISAITDRHRNRIRFGYNEDGVPVEVTHSGGYRVLIDTAAGRITGLSVVDRGTAVPVKQFGYHAGELTSVTNGVGAVMRYAYDDEHRMVSWTDSNGNQMVNTYDQAGRVVYQRGTAGMLNCDFDYLEFPDGTGSATSVTDSLGAITTHGFDRDLQLRDLVDPAGARTHFDYNADRRPLVVTAPDGAVTRYRYTGQGDVAQIIRPDGGQINLEYVFRHRPITITDADGSVRHQEWNKDGDRAAVTDAAGVRTEYRYHPNGAVAEITESGGARTTVETDAAGLPTQITDAHGSISRLERDGFGRPIVVTDPLGASIRYEWSGIGKPLRRLDPDGYAEAWTYDGEGKLLAHTNRAGEVTTLTYGAFDLIASRTDPDGSTTRYTWDTERRLRAVTNPLGQTWTYEYDDASRLTTETDYVGTTTRYTYDTVGRVAAVTPATGVTRRHQRDILGRVTELAADTGEFIRYTYDNAGRRLTATTGTGEDVSHTLRFTYTVDGQLASQQLDDQPVMRHDYDAHGRRFRRTTPNGATTAWQWDHTGRIRGLSADGNIINFVYDEAGRRTGWRVGEIVVDQHLSPVGHLTEQTVTAFPASSLSLDLGTSSRPEPRQLRHDRYTYRPDGYLTGRTVTGLDIAPERYDYLLDPTGRVSTIANNGVLREQYEYDPLGNVTNALSSQATTDTAGTDVANPAAARTNAVDSGREYRNNLLVRDGRTRYHYDESGRLIRKETTRLSRKPDVWHYRYNAFDQLTDVYTPDRQWWRYTYDGLGRRTTKQHLNPDGSIRAQTDYTWDGTQLVEQKAPDSSIRWNYQPGSHVPISQTADQDEIDREFYAIITDLVGAPQQLIRPDTAATVAVSSSDLWGITRWIGQTATPLRFSGQYHDAETGLHYNYRRVYDPATGRYLTPDPLGLAPAANPYSYPRNPTSWTDPLGLMPTGCENSAGQGHTYYRSMSEDHFQHLDETGQLLSTGETSISPTQAFSEDYDGRLVEFQLRPGTIEELAGVGVRDDSNIVKALYPDMPEGGKGWAANHARFKGEGDQINIALGRGPGLEIFNRNIISYREIK
jgi:RHS repeat-associated protein